MIQLLITACLLSNPNACSDIHAPTQFVSVVQCQLYGQQALAQIMQAYPKRRVARYKCEEVRTDRDA